MNKIPLQETIIQLESEAERRKRVKREEKRKLAGVFIQEAIYVNRACRRSKNPTTVEEVRKLREEQQQRLLDKAPGQTQKFR